MCFRKALEHGVRHLKARITNEFCSQHKFAPDTKIDLFHFLFIPLEDNENV